jgi:hypothetical protein
VDIQHNTYRRKVLPAARIIIPLKSVRGLFTMANAVAAIARQLTTPAALVSLWSTSLPLAGNKKSGE